uniref:Uncharacterized protein n=1 Tax=Emiliania huxleyi (strain CCMP1516) TaxID=280463 RepID=A0A0D3IDA2_EMIH1
MVQGARAGAKRGGGRFAERAVLLGAVRPSRVRRGRAAEDEGAARGWRGWQGARARRAGRRGGVGRGGRRGALRAAFRPARARLCAGSRHAQQPRGVRGAVNRLPPPPSLLPPPPSASLLPSSSWASSTTASAAVEAASSSPRRRPHVPCVAAPTPA